MGCQGGVCVIYGVVLDGTCEWEASREGNPVVYSVNGCTMTPSEDLKNISDAGDDLPPGCPPKIDHWAGIPSCDYGAADMKQAKLVMRVLGHSHWMGARHATAGLGSNAGKAVKVLVGYVTGSESYIDSAASLAPEAEVVAQTPRLVEEIKSKLGVDVAPEDLGAYVLFDYINGM